MTRNQFLVSIVALMAGPLYWLGIQRRKSREIHLSTAETVYGFYLNCEKGHEEEAIAMLEPHLPVTIYMPCGEWIVVNHPSGIPREDRRCPCGNPNHMLVKWDIRESLEPDEEN